MDEAVFKQLITALGLTVKDLRQSRNLTQEETAFGAGVSVRHFQQLESGTGNPTLLTLCRIATMLNQPVSKLVKQAEHEILDK